MEVSERKNINLIGINWRDDRTKAIDWLNQLLQVDPDDVQGILLLGVAYAGNGEKEEAREQFEKVKKLDSDPAVQQQADAYLKDLH